jgi:hypothetical protein
MRSNLTVNGPRVLQDYTEAQLLAIEGKRLIAQEIAEAARGLRRRVVQWLNVGQRRLLPLS